MMTIEQIEELVVTWAEDRGILAESAPEDQFGKALEEIAELFRALRGNDDDGIRDGIGDVLVCLAILANMVDMDLQECFADAWDQIKDRKGQMRNGVFVKENV